MRPTTAVVTAAIVLIQSLGGCTRAGFQVEADTVAASTESGPGLDVGGDLSLADLPAADNLSSADVDLLGCAAPLDASVVARWSFDALKGAVVEEEVGKHAGTLIGTGAQLANGAPGCSNGLTIPYAASSGSYVIVPDHAAWQLPQGSIDFRVRFSTLGQTQGIVSRDAGGSAKPGHIIIFRACDGAVVVRLQRGSVELVQCSAPVPDNVWLHVGVNFGAGLQLFVDGKLATRTDAIQYSKPGVTTCAYPLGCGKSGTGGIDGNNNPLIIGALSFGSTEGMTDVITHHLGGVIDALRISTAPRPFGPSSGP